MSASSPVVIAAATTHTASVIFLHGLGDTGHGWATSLQLHKLNHVKYICPTAPIMPVTLNSGCRMTSWFDLKTLNAEGPEDEEGIKKASKAVMEMIEEEERNGIPSDRIILGGFSQGGALAMYSALHYTKPLGGVVALSCWLPLYKQFPYTATGNTDVPLLQCHGELDIVVPFRWGRMTHDLLKTFMTNVDFKSYKGLCHSSSEEAIICDTKDQELRDSQKGMCVFHVQNLEMIDVKEFMGKCLPESF